MATSYTFTTYSEIFCCGNCHDAVRIEETMGGELVYQCSNPACQKAVSVDCPEALAVIEDVTLKLPVKESADMDFSADAPTVNAQMRSQGMRLARTWERGWYVTVIDMGRTRKVWACEASEPVAKAPVYFGSYADAKMR